MALSALLLPRVAFPALPPASSGQPSGAGEARAGVAAPAEPVPSGDAGGVRQDPGWTFPHIRLGGTLSYDIRRDAGEGRAMTQRGLAATLNAATETWIWQPWFAQLGANLNFSTTHSASKRQDIDLSDSSRTRSVVVTGTTQLRILPQSRFPFEAHIERNDSRVSSELVSVGGYAGQRYGFTQHYLRPEGDAMVGWDRSTQTSDSSGTDRQDTLQLAVTHNLELHRFQVNGNHSRNVHDRTGEYTSQDNLTLQHSYSPDQAITLDTTANVSRSGYHLAQGDNRTDLMQLSTIAFWRPAEQPLTVTGGARLLALSGESSNETGFSAPTTRLRNANVNVGMTYDLTRFLHLNTSANSNILETNGRRSSGSNQTAGLIYQPETMHLGGYQYNWSTSGAFGHRTGGADSGSQLTLQLSHSLNRNFNIDEGSIITVELNQALSAIGSAVSRPDDGTLAASTQVTNGAAVSWNLTRDNGSALVRMSASDSRALDGNEEFFQLINLQASSNMPTSGHSSWSGSLTIQAVRQGGRNFGVFTNPDGSPTLRGYRANDGFVTTSSGSLTYQNQRAFGVRRLRFVSDLRLNGQALLPLFGGPQDQEMAAWENRLDYFIGRTQLRLSMLVARTTVPTVVRNGGDIEVVSDQANVKVNKSIMFSVIRAFGDY